MLNFVLVYKITSQIKQTELCGDDVPKCETVQQARILMRSDKG